MNARTLKRTIQGPDGLALHLDAGQICPEDPGQGTPATVTLQRGRVEVDSGTFNCALDMGELSHNGTPLSRRQAAWLASMEATVEAFLEKGGSL